ncbi:MAG: serine hydrolase [Erythrobacter sp.]
MLRTKPLLMIACGSFFLCGCISAAEPAITAAEAQPPQIEASAEEPTGAPTGAPIPQPPTVLDVDQFQPQSAIAGCDIGAELQPAESGEIAHYAASLEQAQSYSLSKGSVGLIVLKNGRVIHEQYDNGATAINRTTSLSMMKSVLGLSVGIALEKGLIGSLNDPVGSYLPEWQNDPRGSITIEQLLTMSSGLGPSNFGALMAAPNARPLVLGLDLVTEPGSSFAYNNAVSAILGFALDGRVKAAGYSGFADFLQKELWCPLGNDDAALWLDGADNPRFYAGMQANLRDWARLGELIRNKGKVGERQVVSEAWIDAMLTPSDANAQYGYQIWLGGEWTANRSYGPATPLTVPHSEPYGAPDVMFFDGFGGQRVYVVPSHGLTIARTGLINLTYDDSIIVNALLKASE